MRYVSTFDIGNVDYQPLSPGGYPATIFRLNNIAYPVVDQSGTWPATTNYALPDSHRPRGYDQMASIYKSYCVIGAKVTLEVMYLHANPSNQTAGERSERLSIISYIDDDTKCTIADGEFENGITEQLELGMPMKKKSFAQLRYDDTIRTHARFMRHKFSTRKHFRVIKGDRICTPRQMGMGEEDLDNYRYTDYEAAYGSNPLQEAYLKVACTSRDDLSGMAPFAKARICIEYMVVSHSPKELAESDI